MQRFSSVDATIQSHDFLQRDREGAHGLVWRQGHAGYLGERFAGGFISQCYDRGILVVVCQRERKTCVYFRSAVKEHLAFRPPHWQVQGNRAVTRLRLDGLELCLLLEENLKGVDIPVTVPLSSGSQYSFCEDDEPQELFLDRLPYSANAHHRDQRRSFLEYLKTLKPEIPPRSFKGLVKAEVHFVLPSWRSGDLDNLLKGLLDGMIHMGYFRDDSQVATIVLTREFVEDSGCQVRARLTPTK